MPASPQAPYPETIYGDLYAIEDRHWWFVARNRLLIWLMRSRVSRMQAYLEVGCGTGFVLKAVAAAFPDADLEASEYYASGLKHAQQRVPRCQFRELDATTMQEQQRYDCIGCFDVLEHIEADQLVLSHLWQALRDRGQLLITVPQHRWLWSGSDDYAHHVRRYSSAELRRKLQAAGFRINYQSSFVSLLVPLMALQRLTVSKANYNPRSEFEPSRLLNQVLSLIMLLEYGLMRLGLRFPAGGSLVVLARKS